MKQFLLVLLMDLSPDWNVLENPNRSKVDTDRSFVSISWLYRAKIAVSNNRMQPSVGT